MTEAQKEVYEFLTKTILDKDVQSPVHVAINGKDASGKTVMADTLATYLRPHTNREIIRISIDDFMNERAVRYTPAETVGTGCYKYTFNFESFIRYVLKPLQEDGSLVYKDKVFDHGTDSVMFSNDKIASRDAIVIIDGVFLYRHDLVHYWDIKVLLETDDATAIKRGAKRDIQRLGSYEVAKQKYIERYIASQTIYYTEEHPEKSADIVIDHNDFNSPALLRPGHSAET